ncbi:RCC1 domain-containing protein [Leucobacter sp. BZR 635]
MKRSTQQETGRQGQRTPLVRAGIWTAAAAAIVAVTLGVSSGFVGAIATDRSTVHGNEFSQALRVDAGIYELVATPEVGAGFGPGQTAGTVGFAMQPAGEQPVPLTAGESLAATVLLPAGMRPAELPLEDSAPAYARAWSAEEQAGQWRVTTTVVARTDEGVRLPYAEFGVVADFPEIRPAHELTLTAAIELPERLTSTSPEATAEVPAIWDVASGVYGLDFAKGSSRSDGTLTFASHPDEEGETLFLRDGDIFTTEVTLPAGVTAGALPGPETTADRSIEWSVAQAGADTVVTRTERISADIAHAPTARGSFPVLVTGEAGREGFAVRALASLPVRFVSAQPEAGIEVSGGVATPTPARIAAGRGHSLAVNGAGTPYAWGLGHRGQLGSGQAKGSDVPVLTQAPAGRQFTHVAAGWEHSLAVADDGTLWGWGDNDFSQTGTGLVTSKPVTAPAPVRAADGAVRFQSVSAGWRHSVALSTDGRVYVWGDANRGVLGNGSFVGITPTPTPMQGLPNKRFVAVEAGFDSTFAVTEDGEVWATGSNEYGMLGLGEGVTEVSRPQRIAMPVTDRIVQVSAASTTNNVHVLAVTESGGLLGWGVNGVGEIGVPLTGDPSWAYFTPTEVLLPEGLRLANVAAGDQFSLGLSDTGRVYSWGAQALGTGKPGSSAVPVPVALPARAVITDIAAGDMHAFALAADGTLYGWGSGRDGRLGNDSQRDQLSPIVVKLRAPRSSDDVSGADAQQPAAEAADEHAAEHAAGSDDSSGDGEAAGSSTATEEEPSEEDRVEGGEDPEAELGSELEAEAEAVATQDSSARPAPAGLGETSEPSDA